MPNNIAIYSNSKNIEAIKLKEFLTKYSDYPVELNPKIKHLKNSTVYIFNFNRNLLNLNRSNKIILMHKGDRFAPQNFLLLPLIDSIIATTQCEALQISWQIKQRGFNTQVTYLLPWCKIKNLTKSDIYCPVLNNQFKKALVGKIVQNIDPNANIHIYLDQTFPYCLLEGMRSGAAIIALDKPPFTEFIIHGHNGYLIRSPGDLTDVFSDIDKNYHWISHNAKMSMNAIFNPTRYLDSILNPEKLTNVNSLVKVLKKYSERTWLVRERILKNGRFTYYPTQYSKDLTVIDLNSVEEILGYFLTQEFEDVYVFGCELPEELEEGEEVILQRLIIRLGKRSLKIHFCRDNPVPEVWKRIFKRLSMISINEGLKQVSG